MMNRKPTCALLVLATVFCSLAAGGFGIDGVKAPLQELGTPGEYNWGFYYTGFRIDPKEQMIVVFMAQLHPTGGLSLNSEVNVLAYQAIMEP